MLSSVLTSTSETSRPSPSASRPTAPRPGTVHPLSSDGFATAPLIYPTRGPGGDADRRPGRTLGLGTLPNPGRRPDPYPQGFVLLVHQRLAPRRREPLRFDHGRAERRQA